MINKVVVVGGDHHNTLGVIESLGQKNIEPYVALYTNYTDGYVLYSKYVEDGWCCSSEAALIKCLLNNFSDKVNKAVVIVTNDIVATILDKNYEILKDYFFLPITIPAGSMSDKMSKEYMTRLAEKVGFLVPKTWVIHNNEVPCGVTYPIITKAISSVEGSKENIRVCFKDEELHEFLTSGKHCDTIQIQQYIDKLYEFQLLGCSLKGGGEIIIPGRTHIYRPNGMDNTFFLRFDKCERELDNIIEKAKLFIKETGYSGPFSLEFLHDKNGNNYFTEMNFRNDGNAYCVTSAGTNIPYIFYLSQIGKDYQEELKRSDIRTTYLCPEVYYFTCLLSGELGFREWYQNMKRATCYTTYFKTDKKVFFWFVWLSLKKRLGWK